MGKSGHRVLILDQVLDHVLAEGQKVEGRIEGLAEAFHGENGLENEHPFAGHANLVFDGNPGGIHQDLADVHVA